MKKPILAPISPQTQKLMAVSAVLFVAIFSYDWILAPHSQYLQAAEQKTRSDDLLGQKLRDVEMKSRLYGKKIDELKSERRQAGERLFGTDEAETFFSGLVPMAEACGCQIRSVTFKTLTRAPEFLNLEDEDVSTLQFRDVQLDLSGSGEGWEQFLGRLESTGRLMFPGHLTLNSGRQEDARLTGTLKIVVPILRDLTESAAAAEG